MKNRQTKICCFIHSNQCKNTNHDNCKQIWKSADVEVTCDCSCHKEIVSVSGKRSNRHKFAGRQSTLEEIQAD